MSFVLSKLLSLLVGDGLMVETNIVTFYLFLGLFGFSVALGFII